jgi:hypothetical protein
MMWWEWYICQSSRARRMTICVWALLLLLLLHLSMQKIRRQSWQEMHARCTTSRHVRHYRSLQVWRISKATVGWLIVLPGQKQLIGHGL